MRFAELVKQEEYRQRLVKGLTLALAGITSWLYVGSHLQTVQSAAVFDYVLSVLPAVQNKFTTGIYVYLYLAVLLASLAVFLWKEPARVPYILAVFGVLLLMSNLFYASTVLAPPADRPDRLIAGFEFDHDLFPSRHVGVTFLLGLLTQVLWLRYLLFGVSVILGIDVLLLHVHYSFDVLGGYVVAYAVYKFGEKYLKKWFEFPESPSHWSKVNQQK